MRGVHRAKCDHFCLNCREHLWQLSFSFAVYATGSRVVCARTASRVSGRAHFWRSSRLGSAHLRTSLCWQLGKRGASVIYTRKTYPGVLEIHTNARVNAVASQFVIMILSHLQPLAPGVAGGRNVPEFRRVLIEICDGCSSKKHLLSFVSRRNNCFS